MREHSGYKLKLCEMCHSSHKDQLTMSAYWAEIFHYLSDDLRLLRRLLMAIFDTTLSLSETRVSYGGYTYNGMDVVEKVVKPSSHGPTKSIVNVSIRHSIIESP